jgi:hypothetical protein
MVIGKMQLSLLDPKRFTIDRLLSVAVVMLCQFCSGFSCGTFPQAWCIGVLKERWSVNFSDSH